jgi:hypothetical protein
MSGRALAEPVAYLKALITVDLANPVLPAAHSHTDFLSVAFLVDLFQYAAAVIVAQAGCV